MIIGTAKEMVTPHVLMKMGGYAARTEPFEGIHDDLYVRSCLLKNEDKQIVIISYDIIHFNYCLNKRIQDYLCDRYGVKKKSSSPIPIPMQVHNQALSRRSGKRIYGA